MGKNVADFFMAKVEAGQAESHQDQKAQLIQYQNWLQALKSQVCEYLPQCAYSLSDPALIKATDLLRLLIAFKNKAWAAYQADWQNMSILRLTAETSMMPQSSATCLAGCRQCGSG